MHIDQRRPTAARPGSGRRTASRWPAVRYAELLAVVIAVHAFAGVGAVPPEPVSMGLRTSESHDGIEIGSRIPDTVTIRRTEGGVWEVMQQKPPGEPPPSSRPPDYAQLPTWLEIRNSGTARTVELVVRWVDTGSMNFRKSGYLKHDGAWTVVTGEISPDRTAYRLEIPAGTSWFGPVPWYGNEDAANWIDRIASTHPDVRVRSVGKTKEGRDIRCLTIGNETGERPRPNVLIVAREHATESSTSFAVEAVVEHLLSEEFPRDLRDAFCFHIVPLANPDGVANGTKFPQRGPLELSDLHYAGMTAQDPTCVAMREETLRLRPVCFVNYHSYLLPMPQLLFYDSRDGVRILEAVLAATELGKAGDAWYLKRLPSDGDTTLVHCHRNFGSLIALVELPWAGRTIDAIRLQGVATFRAALKTLAMRAGGADAPAAKQ